MKEKIEKIAIEEIVIEEIVIEEKIIWICLLVTVLLTCLYFVCFQPNGNYVKIARGEDEPVKYDLSRDDEIVLEGLSGERNVLCIEKGEIYMKEASCPDKICQKQGCVSKNGQTIICLPNHVVVTVVSDGEKEDMDAVTW